MSQCYAGLHPVTVYALPVKSFLTKCWMHPVTVYAELLNEIQDAQSNNSICVFVLKSELKIEVLEGVNNLFRPIGVGRNVNNL